MARRTKAGGAKKRPTRYDEHLLAPEALANGLRAHRHGRFAEARAHYREAVETSPELVDAWANLGTACVSLGLAREAASAFTEATRRLPTSARLARDVGIGLLAVGNVDAAKRALETAVALDPNLHGARLFLCRVCLDSGDREAAVAHAAEATERSPGDASAHLELHRALFDDRDVVPSIAPAEKAVSLDPDYALARFFLAGTLALGGKSSSAEAMRLGLAPHLVDALDHCVTARERGARMFATKRDTLTFAANEAALAGPVLEFGVRHAVSTRVLAPLATEVHAFDSFEGLPDAWVSREPGAFSTSGELPEVPANVRLHVGLFESTLPAYLASSDAAPRLVHIDSDLYESARTVLARLAPRIHPGCVLVFDEFVGNASWRDDEFRAFSEAASAYGWDYELLAVGWITGQAVLRIRSLRDGREIE